MAYMGGDPIPAFVPPGALLPGAVNFPSLGPDVLMALGTRNVLVDGNFDSWIQTSGNISSGQTAMQMATMYRFACGTGGAATIAANGISPGTEPPGMTTPAVNGAAINQTTASTGTVAANTAPYMSQNVENVRTLQGRSATFSCWMISPNGNITIPQIICRQSFGTGGSPSTQVIADKVVNWVVTPTTQRFSVRLDIPSINGKTLGTNNDHAFQIGLWLPPGVIFFLATYQWQLEQSDPASSGDLTGKGGNPTPFEYRGPQAEFARVQRYYQYYTAVPILAVANGGAWNGGMTAISIPPMRASPAVSPVNNGSGSYTGSLVGQVNANNLFQMSFGAAATANQYALANVAIDARL